MFVIFIGVYGVAMFTYFIGNMQVGICLLIIIIIIFISQFLFPMNHACMLLVKQMYMQEQDSANKSQEEEKEKKNPSRRTAKERNSRDRTCLTKTHCEMEMVNC